MASDEEALSAEGFRASGAGRDSANMSYLGAGAECPSD